MRALGDPPPEDIVLFLYQSLEELSPTIGESCVEDMPRHFHFRDKLSPNDVRREVMLGALYVTRLFLDDLSMGSEGEEIVEGIAEILCARGALGNVSPSELTDTLSNRFDRYIRARQDPLATTEEVMKLTMMGIVCACSLGLTDKARVEFAKHVGAHLLLLREDLRRAVRSDGAISS